MYGSNHLGKGYYGQGAAESEVIQFHTIAATITTTATITTISIINKILTATVTATAATLRMALKTLTATTAVASVVSLAGVVIKALNVVRGVTKLLNPRGTTRDLTAKRTTAPLPGFTRTTRQIQVED